MAFSLSSSKDMSRSTSGWKIPFSKRVRMMAELPSEYGSRDSYTMAPSCTLMSP